MGQQPLVMAFAGVLRLIFLLAFDQVQYCSQLLLLVAADRQLCNSFMGILRRNTRTSGSLLRVKGSSAHHGP